jgi:four helix bundle protein
LHLTRIVWPPVLGSQYAPFRSQIIRAALSIPANIVEGREQKTDAGFPRFLRIALGSASELEYHLTAAHDIQAISTSEYQTLSSQVVEVRRMLHGLIRRLERGDKKTAPELPNLPRRRLLEARSFQLAAGSLGVLSFGAKEERLAHRAGSTARRR